MCDNVFRFAIVAASVSLLPEGATAGSVSHTSTATLTVVNQRNVKSAEFDFGTFAVNSARGAKAFIDALIC